MRRKKNRGNVLLLTVLFFGVMSFLGSAGAMQFQPGKDTVIDCDVKLKYDIGIRVEDQEQNKLGDANTDDGNRNFDKWDLINNKVTLLADIDIHHKNFGLFVRPKVFYDVVYMADNADNTTGTNNAVAGGLVTGSDDWPDKVETVHGRAAEILDLFAYASLDIGGHNVNLRVGRQVISWGESMFLAGGISEAQAPTDIVAATDLGKELKEIFLPTEAVYLQVNLTDKIGLGAYYQWKWEKNRFMEGGTFFSTGDFIGQMGAPMVLPWGAPLFSRGNDDDASDSGQYGITLTYMADWLKDTEFALYYLNYHDKGPTVNVVPPLGSYFFSYTEDIKLYGASFSSCLWGELNISGEISYHQDYMFDQMTKGDYYTGQASWMYSASLRPFADKILSMGEAAFIQYDDTPDDEFAWRYLLRTKLEWYQVLPDLDLSCTVVYQDFPNGTTNPGLHYSEGAASGSLGFVFLYKYVYSLGITYDTRFNWGHNSTSDRDNISATFTYTF